jgi:hypothetical protein
MRVRYHIRYFTVDKGLPYAVERMTGIHRDTIMRLGTRVGRGCAELHDRTMVGLRVGRQELDELWAFVGKKQRHSKRADGPEKGDQYTFVAPLRPAPSWPIALASATRAPRKSLWRTIAQ